MKNVIFSCVLTLCLATLPLNSTASEKSNATNEMAPSTELNQMSASVKTAYRHGGSILVQVEYSGRTMYVVAYCSGRDYQGRQIWDNIEPVAVQEGRFTRATTSDAAWNNFVAQCNYCFRLGDYTFYMK